MPPEAGRESSSQTPSRFWRITSAGIFFQGGAAALDPNTILAALVFGLTGSTAAVGAAAAITRYGWLFPQIFVAYAAARRRHRTFHALPACPKGSSPPRRSLRAGGRGGKRALWAGGRA